MRSQSEDLNAMLVSGDEEESVIQELLQYVNFTTEYGAKTKRPRSLVIFFNQGADIDFYGFLRFVWEKKFLDFTVIEFQEPEKIHHEINHPNTLAGILVHQYNPFNDTHKQEAFSMEVQLYAEKLKDLYGYTLNTGFYDFYPFIYHVKDISTDRVDVYGVERIITEALAKAINFSFTVKLQYVASQEVVEGLMTESIDFSASTFIQIGIPDIQSELSTETSIFIYSFPDRAIIRQDQSYKAKIATHSIFIASIFVTIIIIF